jgi:Fe-S-cluster-containing dehydrogenase component
LTALGYVDVLRVPTHVLEEHVFPRLPVGPRSFLPSAGPTADDARMEWAVEQRLINGTQTMLIDLDRCVRCDDCVRACAATHDGNPRFVRHGWTHDHWMVTNACMHCADPVCMIGCPTGAISREIDSGTVLINDATCIGCATCANSCPYDNIRMVEIRDLGGQPVVDEKSHRPILKATKCDLCASSPGGPACVRACPHDALQRVDFRDLAQVGVPR